MTKECSKFSRNLREIAGLVQWNVIDAESTMIKLDENTAKILKRVNLQAILRATPSIDVRVQRFSLFDHLLQPVIGYFDKAGVFRVIAGITTYHQCVVRNHQLIPAFVFSVKPRKDKLDMLLFSEITGILLEKQPILGVENMHQILCALFEAKTADIFTSPIWQALYPQITNKAQLCKWQGISSKTFRDKPEAPADEYV